MSIHFIPLLADDLQHCYAYSLGEKTIADAILDRLVHDAHRIELMGESMRKTRNKAYSDMEEISN